MSATIRRIISTAKAPAAIGPYSQAVLVDKTLYISGQLGLVPGGTELVEGGVRAETEQSLKNMGEVLVAAGASFSNGIVKVTILLADISDFQTVNEVYKSFFTVSYPARAAYQVAALPKNGRVEIEAVAIVGEINDQKGG